MANDAMLLAVDMIRFTYPRRKRMRVYAVGIAADNKGKVMVTEPPSSAMVRHRPKLGKPAIWDFGGDGYSLYHRTGGLADIIVAHLLIVRDRSGTRQAGGIVREVSESDAAKSTIKKISSTIADVAVSGMATASALGLVLPIVTLVGNLVGKKNDKILQTISGSLFLDEQRRQEDEFSQTIISPDNNIEVEADVFLFDGVEDEDTTAETTDAEKRQKAEGLLFTSD